MERPAQLHIAFQALDQFRVVEKRLPKPRNEADALKVLELAKKVNADAGQAKVDALDEKLIKLVSYLAAGSLSPMNAFFGGFVAQEVIKVCCF